MPKAASSLMNDEEVNEPRHPQRQSMSINLLLLLAIVTTIRPLSRNRHLVRGEGKRLILSSIKATTANTALNKEEIVPFEQKFQESKLSFFSPTIIQTISPSGLFDE